MANQITDLLTNIEGKVRNLPSFYNEALLPVFEAVANSIQAIEDVSDITTGKITVRVVHQESLFDGETDKRISDFEIVDNGVGFTEANFTSFCTSDSTYKSQKGCKGIGRFLWLKAFDRVEVVSVYEADGHRWRRDLQLTVSGIVHSDPVRSDSLETRTTVRLVGFKDEYYKQASAYKTTAKIAQRIFEHCLSYYITNKAPLIIVEDEQNTIDLHDTYETIKNSIVSEEFKTKDIDFKLHHVKLFSTHNKLHNIVLCADHRDVRRYGLSRLIGSSSQIDTGTEKFVYAAYVESPYLDNNVNSTRQDFNFPERANELLSDIFPLSLSELVGVIEARTKKYLDAYIVAINEKKKQVVDDYIEKDNPTLRAVVRYCPEVYADIEPGDSKEKIDETLYSYKGKAEFALKKVSTEILKTSATSIDEIKDRFKELEDKIEDFQKDQLASYLIFRKMIIELLKKKLEINKNGKYSNEAIIHDIIFPRKTTTNEIMFDDHNLWLIDERLAFHSFASSDLPLSQISTSTSDDRPDICVFSEVDEDNIARSVSLVEFKKPERKNFDEDPTKQLLRYVRLAREQKVHNTVGRTLNTNECTKFYCYAICDINSQIIEYAENNRFSKLKNELGYYFYNDLLNSHIEIIAFDKLVVDARQRHRIFFEKLGI